MRINVNQIDGTQLANAINAAVSGSSFSGMLNAYVLASGYLGDALLYVTGGSQSVYGQKTFVSAPIVPYSGAPTGSAASQAWVNDRLAYYVASITANITGNYVPVLGDSTVYGKKNFTGAVGVGTPVANGDAVNVALLRIVSGVITSGYSSAGLANAVTTDTTQTISGEKTFTISPKVPSPTSSTDAVNKSYVDALNPTGVVYTTGDQSVSGVKIFLQSPLVPLATQAQQAVSLQQLNALGVSMGPVSGFAGVLSINGSTGAASGAVYLQGAGTVTVSQCGAVFTVSGITAGLTQFYSAQVPLPSGITGLSYTFPAGSGFGFAATPTVTDSLVLTGSNGGFVNRYIYGLNTSGFNVAFSSAIPSSDFVYHFDAIPTTGGSGFFGLQGQDGRAGSTLNSRGVWQPGMLFTTYDWVYQTANAASYVCNLTHISTAGNTPGGTGNGYWSILSSGSPGPTGFWVYRGAYDPSAVYSYTNSVTLSGSSYGYTGSFPVSGLSPATNLSGWGVIAAKGDIGYFVNSGIITGNFVNVSFFLDPVNTGLNLAEAFVAQTFLMTGFALGCVTSGSGPSSAGAGLLSGSIYTRSFSTNSKTTRNSFTFNSGVFSYFSGNMSYPITGMDRIGIDVTNTLSGIEKMSIGVFGFGLP